MKLIIDVNYGADEALAAGIIFNNWNDAEPSCVITAVITKIEPYEPGMFYKRELPCVQKILNLVSEINPPINLKYIIVDGYVWLGINKPGMASTAECRSWGSPGPRRWPRSPPAWRTLAGGLERARRKAIRRSPP